MINQEFIEAVQNLIVALQKLKQHDPQAFAGTAEEILLRRLTAAFDSYKLQRETC